MKRIIVRALLVCWIGTLSRPVLGDVINDDWLSAAAQTPIRLFNPALSGVEDRFQSFMNDTVMVNGRHVPQSLASNVAARIRFFRRRTSSSEPTYFVASYIDRLDAPLTVASVQTGTYPYGEPVYPQAVCPIFATHSEASVPEMLARATGLPAELFEQAPGERDKLHALFILTEASHCGFLSRQLADTNLHSALRSRTELVSLIEAIGDIEAIDAFRKLFGESDSVDEGDVLLAARIVALFSSRKQNVYSLIPAFMVSFDEHGFAAAARQVAPHEAAVAVARQAYFSITGSRLQPARDLGTLLSKSQSVRDAIASEIVDELEPMAWTLLSLFPVAVEVLANVSPRTHMFRTHRATNQTLPGAGRAMHAD